MREMPVRKNVRLKDYDYSQEGAYCVTICVKDKHEILWELQSNVGANCVRPCTKTQLSKIGITIDSEINNIRNIYENVFVDKYVIMPNHIHMIIVIQNYGLVCDVERNGRTQFAPTLSRIVKQFKGSITKQIGFSIWQRSFHEHIIRNKEDYLQKWKYIDKNPQNWIDDEYYVLQHQQPKEDITMTNTTQNQTNSAYKAAGVDVEAGYRAVELMKSHVARTAVDGVLSGIGGFGGLFELPSGYERPVLVSGTDGVGTKLKLAFALDKHDTIGQDCVAMCVNDIICSGAKPLFFLDYIACGKNEPERIADIVKGIADGCVLSDCALVGGETAEMPGFYPIDEYDLAGFSVGVVEKSKIINNSRVTAGDVLIGLRSSGAHSNGFSLIRKVFNIGDDNEKNAARLATYSEELGCTVGEALLEPTRIYVKPMLKLLETVDVKAISHITGGGFYENIPRMLPKVVRAKIDTSSIEIPPIFNLIAASGNIDKQDMYSTFNMGVGMMFAVAASDADTAIATLKSAGENAFIVGEVIAGTEGVDIL